MSSAWDVFQSVRLEVERGIATEAVLARLAAGTLAGTDLIRPAGTARWTQISKVAAFHAPDPAAPSPAPPVRAEVPPAPPSPAPPAPVEELRLRPVAEPVAEPAAETADFEFPAALELEFPAEDEVSSFEVRALASDDSIEAEPVPAASFAPPDDGDEFAAAAEADPYAEEEAEDFAGTVLPDDEAGGPRPAELDDPLAPELEAEHDAEDDPAAGFSLSRPSTEKVEELDLAAMVDVAFQLVLFFLVTASTVVFKTLEIPRPNEDKPPEAAAQSRARSIDELEKDYILVEVDAEGAVKVDHLPVNADRAALVEKLRQARETTGRKAMLLSADFNTRHRNAVLAFDVASEIDLQVAIAQPAGKD